MKPLLLALALWIHTLAWGVGLAWLITPRRWRRFWPLLVPVSGWALQSSVVWFATQLGFKGTDSYALWSLALPACLAVYALRKGRGTALREVLRLWPVWLLSLGVLLVLILPLVLGPRPLTTISLGSCDAADYAAGARVLKEFAASERGGFLGLTEVVQLYSVDNFYDHWLRLNHFTPSAVIALHCTILECQPEHLISLFAASLLALSTPLVYWLSRTTLRFGHLTGLGLAALYGMSPLSWYAVYHVAPGQALAAQAITLITWAGLAWWRGARWKARDQLGLGLLLLAAYALLLGSYHFIILVCLAPAAAYTLLRMSEVGDRKRLPAWLLVMLAPLAAALLLFAGRTSGLIERFLLFSQFDFGWRIPALSPEGWLGMVANSSLSPHAELFRWLLSAMFAGAFVAALFYEQKQRSDRVRIALALSLPAIAGYLILLVRGMLAGTNASYDAYKLLSVFHPGVLAALCLAGLWLGRQDWRRWIAASLMLTLFALNASAALGFLQRMWKAPLRVDHVLTQLRSIEKMDAVASVNMLIPDFWERLWANAFLLKKPQYFESYTYEGRRNTALRGEWNLVGGLIHVMSPNPGDTIRINARYRLHRAATAPKLNARFGPGWYNAERHLSTRWRWSAGNSVIILDSQEGRRRIKGSFRARGLDDRELQVWAGKTLVLSAPLTSETKTYELPAFELTGPRKHLLFRVSPAPTEANPGDSRRLGLCLYGLELELLDQD